mgnify:FL=1
MEFNYNSMSAYTKFIEIEGDSLGSLSLKATSNLGSNYYLVIKSYLGTTVILEYGPLYPDEITKELGIIIRNINYSLDKIEFDDKKIIKRIKNFIYHRQKGKIKIIEVEKIDEATALSQALDLFDYVRNFDKENDYGK